VVNDGIASCVLGDLPVTGPLPETPEVDLLLRPEQIELTVGGGAGVAALVLGVSYFGHEAEVRMRLIDHDADLLGWTLGAHAPQPGDRVQVEVSTPVLAFPRGGSPSDLAAPPWWGEPRVLDAEGQTPQR